MHESTASRSPRRYATLRTLVVHLRLPFQLLLPVLATGAIVRRDRPGGLIHEYSRRAA